MSLSRWSRVSAFAALAAALGLTGSGSGAQSALPRYELLFETELTAGKGSAVASITVTQPQALLYELRLRAPVEQFSAFTGDGLIRRDNDVVVWQPPPDGGRLAYEVAIDHKRNSGAYDALVTDDWAIFRAGDIFPPAYIRQEVDSAGRSELLLNMPDGWSTVTPFEINGRGRYDIVNPERLFDRPTGWIISGQLGVRRDLISDVRVSIAGPVGVGVQRTSMLALIRWTLPYLTREIDSIPDRISVISANDPMWRGGLSAPKSIYIHADRPLLSENSTSTLLHEIVHVLIDLPTQANHDWIDEGVAEYITLEILRRSGTISGKRFVTSIDGFRDRGATVTSMNTSNATGRIKARAVDIFHALDIEIQELTDGRADIFDLVRRVILSEQSVGLAELRTLASETASSGKTPNIEFNALSADRVPGFGE